MSLEDLWESEGFGSILLLVLLFIGITYIFVYIGAMIKKKNIEKRKEKSEPYSKENNKDSNPLVKIFIIVVVAVLVVLISLFSTGSCTG